MRTTPYAIAQQFVGIKEISGAVSNPTILSMLKLDNNWPKDDDVPWCTAFVNYIAWLLNLPRSKSLMARSWLYIGYPVSMEKASIGHDIVILKQNESRSEDANTIDAPGHVGFFAGYDIDGHYSKDKSKVLILGGNQSDTVNVSAYEKNRILGIRRLWDGDDW